MDQRHKDIIRDNYVRLVDDIKPAIEPVCAHLFQSHVISDRMRENILERKTASARAEALLDLIVRRGPHAFEALYLSFLHAELNTAADLLKPINSPHRNLAISSASSTHSDIAGGEHRSTTQAPDQTTSPRSPGVTFTKSWPSEELCKKENIQVKPVEIGSQMYKDYFESLKPLGQTLYYSMEHKIRGRVLIINNEVFIKKAAKEEGAKLHYLSDRKGSSCDKENLDILFKQLGFDVKIHSNKTAQEMRVILEDECRVDHTKFDCFIVFVLSHGLKGKVFGSDGYTVEKRNQTEPRNFLEVKFIKHTICSIHSLRRKPKLFFIQACRGKLEDPGVIAEVGATAGSLETDAGEMDINLQDVMDALSDLEDRTVSDGPDTIPTDADYFLAMSTVAGYVSWRHEDHGTWFIQAIVYIFWKYSHVYDLNRLMTMVNDIVCSAETAHKMKQVAEKTDTLRKTFCFFPGLLPNSSPPSQN